MTYSLVGALAIIIHLIINVGIFRQKGGRQFPAQRFYCWFLYSVIAYHATDALCGVLYAWRLAPVLYADTAVYFALMALSVLLWTAFVVRYLEREDLLDERKDKFGIALKYVGRGFFEFQIFALIVNFFHPILFSIDRDSEYYPGVARYVAFGAQMFMFLLTSIYTFRLSDIESGAQKRRHFTIGLFGFFMLFAVAAQLYYPLLPMYSIGYLLGCCVLHTFVVEDEKAEYLRALEESLNREAQQQRELGATKHLAYTDPLTGVKSKHAYMEAAESVNRRIIAGQLSEFAAVVFDVNGLKYINDTEGHEAGDKYIMDASQLICKVFKHSPVFRIGGDEFSAILEKNDYQNRESLMEAFNRTVEENLTKGGVVISAGMEDYAPPGDTTFNTVFQRADEKMYQRKRALKGMGARVRD